MIINWLERIFRRTMRKYWWNARTTGVRFGVLSVQALIHAEIKVLSKGKQDDGTRQRINELMFILAQTKKIAQWREKADGDDFN